MSEADGFLSRWSRRKREGAVEKPAAAPAPEAPPSEAAPDPAVPAGSAVPVASEAPPDLADLPPVESLTSETDLAPFLRRGVPAALRNAALRRMWLLDPVIASHRDVALDYAWDWNAPVPVPGFDGAITPESVQAFLDRLSPPAAPESPPASPAAPAPDAPSVAEAPAAEVEARAAADAPAAPSPAAPAARDTTVAAPKPRRHGGAMPV